MSDFRETALADLEKLAEGPAWLVDLREQGRTAFRDRGFPTAKDEAWRFTSVRSITRVPFEQGDEPPVEVEGDVPTGFRVRTLAEVIRDEPQQVEPHLGKLADNQFFAALNSALFRDGLVITVEGKPEAPLSLRYRARSGGSSRVVYPRVLVLCQPGSEGTLIERHGGAGENPHLTNSVTEVVVGENASLEHLRAHRGWSRGHTLSTLAARQARDSRFTSRSFAIGGALHRLDTRVELRGTGAECTLDGLYLARTGEHLDHQTLVDHAVPHGTSHQKYKGIVDESGHAVFDGTVIVRKDARKSDAHQENRNLLLSDSAQVHTKPHLEIDNDDVACSHGATVGRLDEKQLFYLRARGMGAEEARSLLTYAFAHELVDRVAAPAVRDELGPAVLAWLGADPALGEMS